MKRAIFIIEKNGAKVSEFQSLDFQGLFLKYSTKTEDAVIFIKGDYDDPYFVEKQAELIKSIISLNECDNLICCFHQNSIQEELIKIGIATENLKKFSYGEATGYGGEFYQKIYRILPEQCSQFQGSGIEEDFFEEYWTMLNPAISTESPSSPLDPIKDPEKVKALYQKLLMS